MIDLHIGALEQPWWRKLLKLQPRMSLYHLDEDRKVVPIAHFVGNAGHVKFYRWMDEQAEQLRTIVELVQKSHHEPSVEPKPGVPKMKPEDYEEKNLG